jgi:hypothetical protein
MLLLSETLAPSLPAGPVFPKAFAEIEPDALASQELFAQGQPYDIFARMRKEAPVAWQHEGTMVRGSGRSRAMTM